MALNQGAPRSSGCSRQSLDPGQHRSPEARAPTLSSPPDTRTAPRCTLPGRPGLAGHVAWLVSAEGCCNPGNNTQSDRPGFELRLCQPGGLASVLSSLKWEYESHPSPLPQPGELKGGAGRDHPNGVWHILSPSFDADSKSLKPVLWNQGNYPFGQNPRPGPCLRVSPYTIRIPSLNTLALVSQFYENLLKHPGEEEGAQPWRDGTLSSPPPVWFRSPGGCTRCRWQITDAAGRW